jgi:hypothetical protein
MSPILAPVVPIFSQNNVTSYQPLPVFLLRPVLMQWSLSTISWSPLYGQQEIKKKMDLVLWLVRYSIQELKGKEHTATTCAVTAATTCIVTNSFQAQVL